MIQRQLRAADAEATWTRRYAELRPRLVRALAATVGTYAGVEDAVQEAFLAAIARDDREIANLGGWLYTVALRHMRRTRRREVILQALRFRRPDVAPEIDQAIARIDLLAMLGQLPQRERELLIAKHYFGSTQDEIAAGFRMKRGTVSATLSRAITKLRALEGPE
ncbi:MAG TPA: RNA polymerase sigma factor [Candidatus Limnocylindria bacterium]|nr:RNA polymerase sigma factor [Candidatus Limnocylindria bacterium]